MSEQFNKDYGDYFSAIEKSIEKEKFSAVENKDTVEQPSIEIESNVPEVKTKKSAASRNKFFGVVFKIRPWVYVAWLLLITIIVLIALPKKSGGLPSLIGKDKPKKESQNVENTVSDAKDSNKKEVNNYAEFTDNTKQITLDVGCESIIFINCKKNEVVASRNPTERCYPASTTKIMTILTAVDYITDYDKTFTFSYEITDPLYIQEATIAGFANGEAINMTDMLYGAILPSGADATVGLALSIAGSEEEFVKLMNKKAKELGLKNTNFTNSSGLFDKNHYTTAEDMAVIVRAAMENELCRKILSTYQYTTAATPQHPEGILLTSTLFSHMYGTEPEGSDILGGKTGFVNESGYCIASFGKSDEGTEYVCVTFKGAGLWPSVHGQIALYSEYAK